MEVRSDRIDAYVWRISAVVIVGAIMSILDTTIVNVALQTLREDLGTSLATIQWISTGYLLALASVIPLTGWAAERFGPRRVWMTAVAAFALTSALCGLARSFPQLVLARVGVGAGEAGLSPAAQSIMADYFPKERLSAALGLFSTG